MSHGANESFAASELDRDLAARVAILESAEYQRSEPFGSARPALIEAGLWIAASLILWILCVTFVI